jgi:hypothetical protein
MASDLLVFLGGEHEHRTTGRSIVDGIARGPIPSFTQANPIQRKAAHVAERTSASISPIRRLTPSCDAIERRCHRRHLLAQRAVQHLNGKSRSDVRRRGFMQTPHVAADALNYQET